MSDGAELRLPVIASHVSPETKMRILRAVFLGGVGGGGVGGVCRYLRCKSNVVKELQVWFCVCQ